MSMRFLLPARRLARPFARGVRRHVLPRLIRPPFHTRAPALPVRSIRVVGLLSSATGLGNSARLCARQLAGDGYSISASDVAPLFGVSDAIAFAGDPGRSGSEAMSLYHLNPPQLLPGILRAGLGRYYRTYNVGYWAWELETLPREWTDAIRFMDAIMVPSQFCRDAVQRYTDKPVRVVPHPLPPDLPVLPRQRDADAPFTVLAMLNFGSSFERKNPYAALRAFKTAFDADPGARLVFKTSGGHRYPKELAELRTEAGDMSNVEVIDAVWSEEKLLQLYRDADVYLSLHRSEGYGIAIAEAMMMECPVVVTAWSGNMDFCSEETAFLVECELIPFKDADRSYAGIGEARWADPSVPEAARALAQIREQPDMAQAKARAARRSLIDFTTAHSYDRAVRSLAAA